MAQKKILPAFRGGCFGVNVRLGSLIRVRRASFRFVQSSFARRCR